MPEKKHLQGVSDKEQCVVRIAVFVSRLSDHAVRQIDAEHDTARGLLRENARGPTHTATEFEDIVVGADVHQFDQLPCDFPMTLFQATSAALIRPPVEFTPNPFLSHISLFPDAIITLCVRFSSSISTARWLIPKKT